MSGNQETAGDELLLPAKALADSGDGFLASATPQATPIDPETKRQLDGIAERANRFHGTSWDKYHEALEYARKCGEELIKAKELLPHGAFGPWLTQNFRPSARMARNYMRIASNWEIISVLPVESIADALAAIRLADSSSELGVPELASEEQERSADLGETNTPKDVEDSRVSDTQSPGAAVELVYLDHSAQETLPAQSSRVPVDKAATVIVLLKKHLKAGPTEAVREELRKVQDFCRQELSKFGTAIDLESGETPLLGLF